MRYQTELGDTIEYEPDQIVAYWSRKFPADRMSDVVVLTAAEWAADGGQPGILTEGWQPVRDGSIDDDLDLCGELTECVLLADRILISGAIHQALGLSPEPWDRQSMWRACDLDDHTDDQAEYFFAAIGEAYGPQAEADARSRYRDN